MKVIAMDNFNRDHVADKLIAENLDRFTAEAMTNEMNESCNELSSYWHVVVDDDYELHLGMEDHG